MALDPSCTGGGAVRQQQLRTRWENSDGHNRTGAGGMQTVAAVGARAIERVERG